jgi:hypothetical protein
MPCTLDRLREQQGFFIVNFNTSYSYFNPPFQGRNGAGPGTPNTPLMAESFKRTLEGQVPPGTSESNSTSSPPDATPSGNGPQNIQAAQQVATAASGALGSKAQQLNSQAADKIQGLSNAVINSQLFDAAGEHLNTKEKVQAGLLGLLSYSVVLGGAHYAAGLDPYMGVLTPGSQQRAHDSLLGRFARKVDGILPTWFNETAMKGNLPDAVRAFVGTMSEDEYRQFYLKQHDHAVNATINKLAKGRLSPGTLTHQYAGYYTHVYQGLNDGTYLNHLTDHELNHVVTTVAQPFMEHSPKAYFGHPELKPHFKNYYDTKWKEYQNYKENDLPPLKEKWEHIGKGLENARTIKNPTDEEQKKIAQLLEDQLSCQSELEALQNRIGPLENLFREVDRNPFNDLRKQFHHSRALSHYEHTFIEHYDEALKKQPHRLNALVALMANETTHKGTPAGSLRDALIGHIRGVNENSLRDAYLETLHKRLFGSSHFAKHGNLSVENALVHLDTDAHAAPVRLVQELEHSVAKVAGVGRKGVSSVPYLGRWLNRISTSDAKIPALRNQVFAELQQNREMWVKLIGESHLDAAIDSMKEARTSADFFKAHGLLTGSAGQELHDFRLLHKVLPRSIKRYQQSIAEHGQFISNQVELSKAWGVQGLGRAVASFWKGAIDMTKFNLHATPRETLECKARALAQADKSGNFALRHTKSFLHSMAGSHGGQLMYTVGAMMTFSSAIAAWMAAGKTGEKKDDIGEKSKAALRATMTIAVPFIGAHQIVTFLNRGNGLGRVLGGHYLTSAMPPFPIPVHWLTLPGAVIALGAQAFLNGSLRTRLEKGVDRITGGPPKYIADAENLEKAKTAIGYIQDEEYDKIKPEDVALIRQYPKAMKDEKKPLTEAQLKLAERMAGQKPVDPISPEEAALMYALARQVRPGFTLPNVKPVASKKPDAASRTAS